MMGLLSWLRRLYSLDTLDTRFTVSATTPLNVAADSNRTGSRDKRDGENTRHTKNGTSSPKWNTPEFYVYYLVFIVAVPLMFKTATDVSQGTYMLIEQRSALGAEH